MSWTNVRFFPRTRTGSNAGRPCYGVALAYCGRASEDGVPVLVVFNLGEEECLKRFSQLGSNSGSRHSGVCSRTSTWNTGSSHSPSPIIRALLIMLCKWREMDFTFPPARLCTALHLLSPFKNTESSEKGNGSFLFVRQQSWHRPVKQSSWAVICKAALCCSSPPPPRLFTRHTQTSEQVISWFGRTCQPGWWKCYSICWQAIR